MFSRGLPTHTVTSLMGWVAPVQDETRCLAWGVGPVRGRWRGWWVWNMGGKSSWTPC